MHRFLILMWLLAAGTVSAVNFVPPFRAEAAAFFFVHDGGPLKLELTTKGGAVLARIFDAEERLVEQQYGVGDLTLSHDFGANAPKGIYQIRYSGKNTLVTPRAVPEKPFGVMPQQAMISPTSAKQFAKAWLYIPKNTQNFGFRQYGCKFELLDADGNLVTQLGRIDGKPHRGKIWQLSATGKPVPYTRFGAGGIPLILCPDPATAGAIRGSLEQDRDGNWHPHKFQVRIVEYLRTLRRPGLTVEPVDFRKFEAEISADPAARGLLGPWGWLTYVNAGLARQNLDPASPAFGTGHVGLLIGAYTIDKPYNPYFGNPKLEPRILHPVLKSYLQLSESESGGLSCDSYSGGDGIAALGPALTYAELAPHLRDATGKALLRDAAVRRASRFSMFRVSCDNQSSHWVLTHQALFRATGDDTFRRLAADLVAPMSRAGGDPYMKTGYLSEAYGPDATYQGITTCLLALYFRMSGDPEVKATLRTIYDLMNHTCAPEPDGKIYGASNFSHRTKGSWMFRQFGAGLPLMKGELPEAALWCQPSEPKKAIAELLRPRPFNSAAAGYATGVIGPYYSHFHYPSKTLPNAGLPVVRERNFTRNYNNEFHFVRRPGYYFAVYTGKTAANWTANSRPKTPANPSANNKWFQTQGISLLWFEQFGTFLLGMNWSGDTAQMVRGDYPDGRIAYPDYWNFHAEWRDNALRMSGGMFQADGMTYTRTIQPLDDGIRQTLQLKFARDIAFRELVEQLPFLKNKTVKLEFLVNGKWQTEGGAATAVRVNGGAVRIELDRARPCAVGPDTAFRNQRAGVLRIGLGNQFKAGDTAEFTYTIKGK